MSTEKMREEFEARVSDRAWFVPGGRVDASLPEGFEYEDFTTDMCWTCWVESRAAVEVELPKPSESYGCMGEGMGDPDYSIAYEEAVEAIESLGLKVKPC